MINLPQITLQQYIELERDTKAIQCGHCDEPWRCLMCEFDVQLNIAFNHLSHEDQEEYQRLRLQDMLEELHREQTENF